MSRALYLLAKPAFDDIYGPEERRDIGARAGADTLVTPEAYHASDTVWPGVEMLFSGWGMVRMDEAFFRRFPALRIVFYGAGSAKPFVTDGMWERGIRLTTANAANAVPVCEYTLAQILCALKQVWQKALYIRKHREYPPAWRAPGAYRATVGLLSLGTVGRLVAERLREFDLDVLAYDPFFPAADAAVLGVELVPLDEVFARSDVVSCHAPWLPETERMVRGRHFEAMRRNATFVNTARGAVVHEEEMIAVLRRRPDLLALLDVTEAEPPPPGAPLYELENVVLTPHMAGSLAHECRRMGRAMVDELGRFLAGRPLRHELDQRRFLVSA